MTQTYRLCRTTETNMFQNVQLWFSKFCCFQFVLHFYGFTKTLRLVAECFQISLHLLCKLCVMSVPQCHKQSREGFWCSILWLQFSFITGNHWQLLFGKHTFFPSEQWLQGGCQLVSRAMWLGLGSAFFLINSSLKSLLVSLWCELNKKRLSIF